MKEHPVSNTRNITTGTPEKLLENLITSFEGNDFAYMDTFLFTYWTGLLLLLRKS